MSKLTASNLKYSKNQISEIESAVRETLSMINDSIEEAHNQGKVSTEFQLPNAFDIPNMSTLEAKKKVYSMIIEDLTSPERGFLVRLFMKHDESKLIITWLSEEDELLREHEKDIIEFYSLPWADRKNKDVPQSIPFTERIKHYK